ncbi:MAG: hypothetical protein ABS40_05845 [Agrobacterium sp. SCN 61-19]|nr:MAG: hypothetical protein ABS40_05845 [Agrobacterium sp. SCN 61-19]
MKHVPPSVKATAFNCPHCQVLTTQVWYSLRADKVKGEDRLPFVITPADAKTYNFDDVEDKDQRAYLTDWAKTLMKGQVVLEDGRDGPYSYSNVTNVHLSKCYECKDVSIWVWDRLFYPATKQEAPAPNPDLPDDIRKDYLEASSILNLSPRGAAALLRLALQKLCKHLGQPGENINKDIKALVEAGLDPRVQMALDAVRVIGNNAVHPGHIDLSDDRATAETLFRLLNLIAEKTISEPKHVSEVYASLLNRAGFAGDPNS